MKKVFWVALMTLLITSVSLSQFGIKGGFNLGTFGGSDNGMSSSNGILPPTARVGLAAGVSYRIGLIAGIAIQPEVVYAQKGGVYQLNQSVGTQTLDYKRTLQLDYIDIPVLVKLSLPIPLVSPYIEGGVSYGILLSAKLKDEVTAVNVPGQQSGSQETDIKEGTTKNDLSLVVGVGIQILILEVDARYNMGMTKLQKDTDAKVYNRGIVLTAGLRF